MAWSKATRIRIMLVIDTVFFLVELISGMVVHSLALMADAFHMLNDIISLLVGLWAVAVAQKASTDRYSYGWLRAEILGAFFNAIFLIALCVSIILEAIGRFIDPPEINNPKVILIVGFFGLASNLLGFVVLGGHGHSHGEHDRDHDHDHGHAEEPAYKPYRDHVDEHDAITGSTLSDRFSDSVRNAEEGHARSRMQDDILNSDGPAYDVLPEVAVARVLASPRLGATSTTQTSSRQSTGQAERRRSNSTRHSFLSNLGDLSIHPASFRQEIIAASKPVVETETDNDADYDHSVNYSGHSYGDYPSHERVDGHDHSSASMSITHTRQRSDSELHSNHNHNTKPLAAAHGHGHNHSDMGMHALVLHVLGDALGNVGVIATALVIWLTEWPGKDYADPAVSLFITLIILHTALPLTFATSKILLQATPDHIDLSHIREDIQALPGVVSCHHVHIWQLSDTNIVASMHIQVSFPISAEGGEKYMQLAKRARKCLHAYGIHSATIQPEFYVPGDALALSRSHSPISEVSEGTSSPSQEGQCLLECVDQCESKGCCTAADPRGKSPSRSV